MKHLFICCIAMWICTSAAMAAVPSPGIHPRVKPGKPVETNFNNGRQRVIVTLRDQAAALRMESMANRLSRTQRKERVRRIQGRITRDLDSAHVRVRKKFNYTPAFAASVTEKGAATLQAMPDVASVEPDLLLHVHTAQGIPLMNAVSVRQAYKGRGIAIAILDTGIDYTHPALGSGGFPNEKVIGGYDFGDNDADPMDYHGHGTSCAGIAAGDTLSSGSYIGGVASDARLYALKISPGASGSAYTSDIINSIEWCIDHADDDPEAPIKVISISFGGGQYSSVCDSSQPAFAWSAANAAAAGIAVFASSGNEGYCGAIASPACLSDVISVGAVFDGNVGGLGFCVAPESCAPVQGTHAACGSDPVAWAYTTAADQVAPYTNISGNLDLLAPANKAHAPATGHSYTDFGGTSAACPYAAGIAACIQSAVKSAHNLFLTPAQIRDKLVASGDSITYTGTNFTIAKPRVNLGGTDMDSDGLAAEWELSYYPHIGTNADDDTDADGLTTLEEFEHQTSPVDEDSDNDGMADGWEVENALDPLADDAGADPDQDTYSNINEYIAGTDPNNSLSYPVAVPAVNRLLIGSAFLFLFGIGIKTRQKTNGRTN